MAQLVPRKLDSDSESEKKFLLKARFARIARCAIGSMLAQIHLTCFTGLPSE